MLSKRNSFMYLLKYECSQLHIFIGSVIVLVTLLFYKVFSGYYLYNLQFENIQLGNKIPIDKFIDTFTLVQDFGVKIFIPLFIILISIFIFLKEWNGQKKTAIMTMKLPLKKYNIFLSKFIIVLIYAVIQYFIVLLTLLVSNFLWANIDNEIESFIVNNFIYLFEIYDLKFFVAFLFYISLLIVLVFTIILSIISKRKIIIFSAFLYGGLTLITSIIPLLAKIMFIESNLKNIFIVDIVILILGVCFSCYILNEKIDI